MIYVGKARSLKNRLNSYFQKNVGEKTYRMIHAASRVDWTLVRSEVEALQLEFTWIKEENPAFNVQFKDDKSYPFLALTLDEDFLVNPIMFVRSLKRKNSKEKIVNTYKVLLNAGFPGRAETLRTIFFNTTDVDLATEPLSSSKF